MLVLEIGIAPKYVCPLSYMVRGRAICDGVTCSFEDRLPACLHALVLEARVGKKCFKPPLYGM